MGYMGLSFAVIIMYKNIYQMLSAFTSLTMLLFLITRSMPKQNDMIELDPKPLTLSIAVTENG